MNLTIILCGDSKSDHALQYINFTLDLPKYFCKRLILLHFLLLGVCRLIGEVGLKGFISSYQNTCTYCLETAPIVLSLTVHPEPPHYSQVSTEKSKECQAFSQEQENASLAAMGKLSRPSA